MEPSLGSETMQEQLLDAQSSQAHLEPPITESGSNEPPFSVLNDCYYFVTQGIPLGFSSVLELGLPPIFNMLMAGHTPQSSALQAALGFGRTFFNTTVLMPLNGMINGYLSAVVPGCIGAGRKDRIPMYMGRSLLLTALCMIPTFCLQFFANPILVAVGVPRSVADDVQTYTRLMLVAAVMLLVDSHFKVIFVSLGYARSITVVSLMTGIGVDMAGTYLFVYRWQLGIEGTALAQIALRSTRVLLWIGLLYHFRLSDLVLGRSTRRSREAAPACHRADHGYSTEKLLCKKELRVFVSLSVPQVQVPHDSHGMRWALLPGCGVNGSSQQ